MNPIRSTFVGIAMLACGMSPSFSAEFSKVQEAIAVFQDESLDDWKLKTNAEEYLLQHQKESLPILMRIVTNQEPGWVYSAYALANSKSPEVVPFFIRVCKDNFFLKDADGRRKVFGFGSKNGCEVVPNHYGSVLASLLGSLGDKRAIPVLQEAAAQGDSAVQKSSYAALHELDAITLDELFRVAKSSSDPGMGVNDAILEIIQGLEDAALAVTLYDRVIAEYPADSYAVASAHYWKVGRYKQLKQYDKALEQCALVSTLTKYPNLVEQMPAYQNEIRQLALNKDVPQAK